MIGIVALVYWLRLRKGLRDGMVREAVQEFEEIGYFILLRGRHSDLLRQIRVAKQGK